MDVKITKNKNKFVLKLQRHHTPQSPGNFDGRVLGRKRNNGVFILVMEHWTSFVLLRIFQGVWEFAQPVYMFFAVFVP